MSERRGLLVMAYGTPKGLDDVEAYYTDIRHGRPPPPELLEDLKGRYGAIGGRSPLLEITEAQRAGLEARLDGVPAYLGMKHAAPSIPDAVELIAADGIDVAVGLVLAPHYSAMSIGDYEKRVRRAADVVGWNGTLTMVESWHLEPRYIDLLVRYLKNAVASLPPDLQGDVDVVFTAHSLPERILQKKDPYPEQLRATAAAVAEAAGLNRWHVGWQSAGRTADPWLGPDVVEVIDRLAGEERSAVVVCPCGFVSDHLEVLYDIDIEAQERSRKLGIELVRTAAPNDDPDLLDMLADVVQRRFG